MSTPRRHVLLLEFLLPFLVERWNVKNFVPLFITSLECLLHLEDINFESRTNNRHRYHPAQGNNHSGFVPWHHFVLVKDFRAVKLGLALNNLNNPIKGQRVCICHHFGSLQKNSKYYKCTKKTIAVIQNFANKSWSQCT
jgi:hypothetical protein